MARSARNTIASLMRVAALFAVPCAAGCDVVIPIFGNDGSLMRVSIEGGFVNMIDRSLYDAWTMQGFANADAIRSITRQYYKVFADDAEILIITSPEPRLGGSSLRIYNDVKGTGLARTDRRAEFGATDTLAQITNLYGRQELTLRTALHELAHRWANRLAGDITLASPLTVSVGHWGFCDVNGQLGGFAAGSLEMLSNGTYRGFVAPNGYAISTIPYAPLELYLLGLAPADEVPDVTFAVNPTITSEELGSITFSADEMRTLTMSDIVAENGLRIPAYGAAPTEFAIAFIVLTAEPMTIEDMVFYEHAIDFLTRPESVTLLEVFGTVESLTPDKDEQTAYSAFGLEHFLNFHRATGGRGSLRWIRARDARASNSR